jgi:hypothetical protein
MTATLLTPPENTPMRPRHLLTIGNLMVAVATVGVELGLLCWIHRETIQHSRGPLPWIETFNFFISLNLWVGGPAIGLVLAPTAWRLIRNSFPRSGSELGTEYKNIKR